MFQNVIDNARLLQTFLDLVQIDSPSREEARVAAYCKKVLEELGFTVRFDSSAAKTGSNTGNLLAWLAPKKPGQALQPGPVHRKELRPMVLSAHMDCVPPCKGVKPEVVPTEQGWKVQSSGDTVLGSDDKAGIAAILEAARVVCENNIDHPGIAVLLTVCEEIGCLGSKAFVRSELLEVIGTTSKKPLTTVVLDSDGAPGTVVVGGPYHYSFVAEIQGRAAHAGVKPEAGVSAIEIASRAISALRWGRLDTVTTSNVGAVEGGVANNIVAPRCKVTGECRSLSADRAETVKSAITAGFEQVAHASDAHLTIDWRLEYPGFLYQETSPLIQRFARAAQQENLPFTCITTGGGSDANILSDKGFNPVLLGVGMTNFHTTEEYVLLNHLTDTTAFICSILREFA